MRCCSTLNIAHRGARSLAPENTLAAARKAHELGADMWEVDIAVSMDGQLFLVHDDTLERTSDVAGVFPEREPWPNHAFTMDEIHRLDFGSWYVEQDPFGQIAACEVTPAELESYRGARAPTFREVLHFTREIDWRINVELKDVSGTPGDAFVVEKAVELIRELDMVDLVLISSFNHDYLRRIRALDPALATGALVTEAHPDPASLVRGLGAQAYHPEAGGISMEMIVALCAQGIAVNVWTVNSPADMRALLRAGASGIITDFPQLLRPLLHHRQG